jgi:hypothetical protein
MRLDVRCWHPETTFESTDTQRIFASLLQRSPTPRSLIVQAFALFALFTRDHQQHLSNANIMAAAS